MKNNWLKYSLFCLVYMVLVYIMTWFAVSAGLGTGHVVALIAILLFSALIIFDSATEFVIYKMKRKGWFEGVELTKIQFALFAVMWATQIVCVAFRLMRG